jgi:hypothetical protein
MSNIWDEIWDEIIKDGLTYLITFVGFGCLIGGLIFAMRFVPQ